MIPVYYFEQMPDKLPEDDACYIISKYIYLKKRSGLINSMVRVNSIDMADILPEYAKMKLPKIKARVFGEVAGFFQMIYNEYKSESGIILNLKTHPLNPKLKKIDYTIPHQRVSGAACKYKIVIDPSYINCGTIHSHADFGAFHSGTDENDEKYFDGLHITVGNVLHLPHSCSISACVVVNGKRVLVNPCDYIEGIELLSDQDAIKKTFYKIVDQKIIVENRDNLKLVTPLYGSSFRHMVPDMTTSPQQTEFKWSSLWNEVDKEDNKTAPCETCIFKEMRVESLINDMEFDDGLFKDDGLCDDANEPSMDAFMLIDDGPILGGYFEPTTPIFQPGDIDEDGIKRTNNQLTHSEFQKLKSDKMRKSIKCGCGTTFFIEDSEVSNICPSCEKEHPGEIVTVEDVLELKTEKL
jgi:hypothetical protein